MLKIIGYIVMVLAGFFLVASLVMQVWLSAAIFAVVAFLGWALADNRRKAAQRNQQQLT